MIESIEAWNYRQFKHVKIDFGPGLTVLRGDNGSGKSTIMEMIAFAEIGTEGLRDTARSWLRDGERAGGVALTQRIGRDRVTVARTLQGASLEVNGVKQTQYRTEATELLGDLLGITPQSFMLGRYIPQQDIDAFTKLGKAKRKAEVERLLNVTRIDTAMARVRGEVSTKNTELSTLARGAKKLTDFLADIQKKQADRLVASDHQTLLLSANSDMEVTLARVKEHLAALEDKRRIVTGLEERIDAEIRRNGSVLMELAALELQLTSARDKKGARDGEPLACHNRLAAVREEYHNALATQSAYQAAKSHTDALEEKVKNLRAALARKRDRKSVLVKNHEEYQLLQEKLNSILSEPMREAELATVNFKIDEANQVLTEAKTRASIIRTNMQSFFMDKACPLDCSVCPRSESDEEVRESCVAKLDELQSAQTEAAAMLALQQAELLNLKQREQDVQKLLREKARLSTAVQDLEDHVAVIEAAERDLAAAYDEQMAADLEMPDFNQSDIDRALADYEHCTAQSSWYTSHLHLDELIPSLERRVRDHESERDGIKQTVHELNSQLQALADVTEQWNRYINRKTDLEVAIQNNTATVAERTTEIALIDKDIKALEEQYKAQEQLQQEMHDLERAIAEHEGDLNEFKGFKAHIGRKILPRLLSVSNTLFTAMVGDTFTGLEITEDYDVNPITPHGIVRSIKSVSGSEKDLALLSLRIALSTLSMGARKEIDFLLLDEITASFDDARTLAAVDSILQLKALYSQIFWITHKKVEDQVADHIIEIERNGDSSTVNVLR